MEVTPESIGIEYLNSLCVYIYEVYGVTMYDFEKDENDIISLLEYINKGNINLTFDMQDDAEKILKVSDEE